VSSFFVSYRRADANDTQRLVEAIGSERVFIDRENIKPGAKWPERLVRALREAVAVLVVIGKKWMEDIERLADKDDWVRREIQLGMKAGKPVLPVLIGGATMPNRRALPPSIAGITERQAHVIRRASWETDVELLLAELERHLDPASTLATKDGWIPAHPRRRLPPGLRSAFSYAWEALMDIGLGTPGALVKMNSRLQEAVDVAAYCGGKGLHGPTYYGKQFDWLMPAAGALQRPPALRARSGSGPRRRSGGTRRVGLLLRRMFRRDGSLDQLPNEEVVAVLMHEAARRRGLPVHVRWHEDADQQLDRGCGLTLVGADLLVHRELEIARLTQEAPVKPRTEVAVSHVRRAYNAAWLCAARIEVAEIRELAKVLALRETKDNEDGREVRELLKQASLAGWPVRLRSMAAKD
jgi:hypothetical protein